MLPLEGRVALVTGAGRGIGRAIALDLAKAGADVAINYASNDHAAEEVRAEIQKLGRRAELFKCNIADDTAVHAMGEAITKVFPKVDILVNNAGITRDKTFIKMTHVEWDDVLNVNLKGPVQMTHLLLPQMVANGWGRVINITSVIVQMGNFGQANYAAAKGCLDAFTKSVASQVARQGVTDNGVAPIPAGEVRAPQVGQGDLDHGHWFTFQDLHDAALELLQLDVQGQPTFWEDGQQVAFLEHLLRCGERRFVGLWVF